MKTDRELRDAVVAELEWDRSINAEEVHVAVAGGVVTLTGRLRTLAEMCAVERAVQRVHGVKEALIDLDVQLDPEHQRTDAEITGAVERALQWHAQLASHAIEARVNQGYVTLAGDVDWDVQRRQAEKAVRTITGVIGVHNKIKLKPGIVPADVVNRIRDALKRHAEREASHIDVVANGSVITLRGTADSWAERRAAYGAAMSVPGVTHVINEIKVGH